MTKTLNQIIFFFLHQNQNIFFSNIMNQNNFLEKNHNTPPPPPFKLNGRSLSTDLYKLYINPLLDRLQDVGIGLKIRNINVNNTECADDIALLSTQLSDAQIMVNMALDFANLEGYELQPKKSVATHIRGNNKTCETTNEKLNMGNITMPEVEQATHLGIIRTTTMKHNIQTNVDENITKARRSA